MLGDGLKRIAALGSLMPIVDDQHRQRRVMAAIGKGGDDCICRRSNLENRALRQLTQLGFALQGFKDERWTVTKLEPAIGGDTHATLAPLTLPPDELADGKRIDKLVGDDNQWPLRQRLDGLVPRNICTRSRQRLFLRAA